MQFVAVFNNFYGKYGASLCNGINNRIHMYATRCRSDIHSAITSSCFLFDAMYCIDGIRVMPRNLGQQRIHLCFCPKPEHLDKDIREQQPAAITFRKASMPTNYVLRAAAPSCPSDARRARRICRSACGPAPQRPAGQPAAATAEYDCAVYSAVGAARPFDGAHRASR